MKFSWKNITKRFGNTYKFNYYKSIDYLPIFNFFKIIETDDKRYLIKIDDYELLPNEVDLIALNKAWNDIEMQYSEAEDSNSSLIRFVTAKGIHKLELEYLMLWDLHKLIIIDLNGNRAKECLEKAGLQDKDFKWIVKRLKVLINKIKLKQAQIKEENPKGNNDDWVCIIDKIEDIKGRRIDLYKTTVRQYIAIVKNIKKDGKRQDRVKGRNRS